LRQFIEEANPHPRLGLAHRDIHLETLKPEYPSAWRLGDGRDGNSPETALWDSF
jgi:hypothetical protein